MSGRIFKMDIPEIDKSYMAPKELKPLVEDINPDKDMPLPLRTCKKCGFKGYGEYYKQHICRRK